VNARDLRLGDTLYLEEPTEFPPIPSFAPSHFSRARPVDPSRHKQFHRGLATLEEEGVVQILSHAGSGDHVPVLGAVGPMQYDVAVHRMAGEFGSPVELTALPYTIARRTDPGGVTALRQLRRVEVMTRTDGSLLALFPDEFWLRKARKDLPHITLEPLFAG
jgi:peptide chain release factor 3